MIGLIQRVTQAHVSVDEQIIGKINKGTLLLLGVEKLDTTENMKQLAKKVANFRMFEDENGKMNKSLLDIKGQLLVVSQFTLVADTQKGNRPGFSNGASPEHGLAMYQSFLAHFEAEYLPCQSGRFGANMQVALVNDGPATFTIKV